MTQLETAHTDLLKEYNQMIEVIKEGFAYISNSDVSEEMINQLLGDIFHGLIKISQSNEMLSSVLADDPSFQLSNKQFDSVVTEIQKLEEQYNNSRGKTEIIMKDVTPAFLAWKTGVQQILDKYLHH